MSELPKNWHLLKKEVGSQSQEETTKKENIKASQFTANHVHLQSTKEETSKIKTEASQPITRFFR
jgi:hypothetical protein